MNALDLVYIPVALATLPLWAGKKRAGWGERLGRVSPLPPKSERAKGRVLLHAVSVGEVAALRHLVPLLARQVEVVVSVTTDTGIARARELFGKSGEPGCHAVFVVRYPLDFSGAVERFLDATKPDLVALVELEVWPNFVKSCTRRGIPVGVINGRLSPRSYRGYRKIRALLRSTFARLAFACVQDEEYAGRFREMGAPPGRVTITGTMKWDAARLESEVAGAEELARELGIDRTRPLVVAGSSAPIDGDTCEEAILHAACPPGVQLLCAPRKPEHFAAAAAALPGCVRRSITKGRGPGPWPKADRFLLDTIGELRQAYALADVVVIGRSFGSLFGSDPIEPIALGKPTLMGPRDDDFLSIVHALERDAALIRTTRATLAHDLKRELDTATSRSPAERERFRLMLQSKVASHQGASQRHADAILACLGA